MATLPSTFTNMEDRALLDAAKRLGIEEHLATAALLRALMEIDTRRLYLGEGCASMFGYCTQILHLAEGAASNRIEAARAFYTEVESCRVCRANFCQEESSRICESSAAIA